MQDEVTGYRYKVKKDGSITSDPDDKNNHYWDAVRYALSRLIRKRDLIFESL
jgi:phage terminase large subunit